MSAVNLISIIIPNYNSSKYISEALNSVLAQTYTNWECIIIDDHSTDNSIENIQHYCSKYPDKFKLYTNPRKGACAARNYGFEQSKGDYIIYLDSDDILSSQKLKNQLTIAEKYPQAVITSAWSHFFNNIDEGRLINIPIYQDYQKPVELLLDMFNNNLMLQTACWLVPRSIIIKAGEWNENLLINQDGEYFSRIVLACNEIKYSANSMVYYRQIDNSGITREQKNERKVNSAFESLYLITSHLMDFENSYRIKKALAKLHYVFIKLYYNQFKEVAVRSFTLSKQLNLPLIYAESNYFFRIILITIGIKNSFLLKKLFKQAYHLLTAKFNIGLIYG